MTTGAVVSSPMMSASSAVDDVDRIAHVRAVRARCRREQLGGGEIELAAQRRTMLLGHGHDGGGFADRNVGARVAEAGAGDGEVLVRGGTEAGQIRLVSLRRELGVAVRSPSLLLPVHLHRVSPFIAQPGGGRQLECFRLRCVATAYHESRLASRVTSSHLCNSDWTADG